MISLEEKRAGLVGWLRMVSEFSRLMYAVKSCLLCFIVFLMCNLFVYGM